MINDLIEMRIQSSLRRLKFRFFIDHAGSGSSQSPSLSLEINISVLENS